MEEILNDLRLTLKSLKLDHLARYISDLYEASDKVHVAFVGEYNAGKSSLINTLLGKKVLAERDLPTTNRVVLVTYCPVEKREKIDDFTELVCVKDERLKNTVLVDTPGLSSAVRQHEEALLKYLHKADLIVIVAPSNQPYTKALENLLRLIAKKHSTQLAYVINIFEDPSVYEEDPQKLERLKEFVREKLRSILSAEDVDRMRIFAFSVRAVRKGIKDYPFLTKEWEEFRRFIFDEVIKEAQRIKENALKEKILKVLSSSSELEELKLKGEKLAGELQRLSELKQNAQNFVEREKRERLTKINAFLEETAEELKNRLGESVERRSPFEVAKAAPSVAADLRGEAEKFLKEGGRLASLEKLLDYRPILVKFKKVYPELLVEPTIPAGAKKIIEEFRAKLTDAPLYAARVGSAAKAALGLFGVLLPAGLLLVLLAKSPGWKTVGITLTGISALGLFASLAALTLAKSRFKKKVSERIERVQKELTLRLEGFFSSRLDERFEKTFADLEAKIERLRRELEFLRKHLGRIEEIKEKLLKEEGGT